GSPAGSLAGKFTDEVIIIFTVSDTGQGMTEEQVNKLFDEYSRFNIEANRTVEGTGLGMSITSKLVKLMNGTISVQSEKGTGSTFTVSLPQKIIGSGVIDREHAQNLQNFRAIGARQIRKAQVQFEPMPYGSVLVVDDIESNLYVAKGLLAPYKLKVETASNGFEAIDKIKSGSVYDIVFMDHMMPQMDGIETVTKLREQGYKATIVALTANAVAGQSDMFLNNGFDNFISKPIDVRQLNAMLKKYIRDKQPPEVIKAAQSAAGAEEQSSSVTEEHSVPSAELADIFTREAAKVIDVIESILDGGIKNNGVINDDDLLTYTVKVHGVKSALKAVNEDELSAAALKLEEAGYQKNVSFITAETPEFIKKLREVIVKLTPKENGENSAESGGTEISIEDRAFLTEKLLVIKKSARKFNQDAARKALGELREKQWPPEVKKFLGAIAEYLLNGDFDELLKTVANIDIIS
ncbi:MAG: response regulator, partial [Treponema sp.]|nr:response regulator [Treponema sp.]